ncbi:MAG: DUF2585 family protein [Phycisphaerales bacterium]
MPDLPPTRSATRRTLAPAATLALIFAVSAVALVLMGRVWWCACGGLAPWAGNVWSSHCSQHLLDPYSLSHTSHGLVFFLVLTVLLRTPLAAAVRATAGWHVVFAALLAGAWEVLENTPFIIERYRSATMSLDYMGDSVVNALGDMACCVLAFVLARRIGPLATLLVFIASELVLLWWIRDNLTLNVIMLVWPVEAIRQWQVVGAPG